MEYKSFTHINTLISIDDAEDDNGSNDSWITYEGNQAHE